MYLVCFLQNIYCMLRYSAEIRFLETKLKTAKIKEKSSYITIYFPKTDTIATQATHNSTSVEKPLPSSLRNELLSTNKLSEVKKSEG